MFLNPLVLHSALTRYKAADPSRCFHPSIHPSIQSIGSFYVKTSASIFLPTLPPSPIQSNCLAIPIRGNFSSFVAAEIGSGCTTLPRYPLAAISQKNFSTQSPRRRGQHPISAQMLRRSDPTPGPADWLQLTGDLTRIDSDLNHLEKCQSLISMGNDRSSTQMATCCYVEQPVE